MFSDNKAMLFKEFGKKILVNRFSSKLTRISCTMLDKELVISQFPNHKMGIIIILQDMVRIQGHGILNR